MIELHEQPWYPASWRRLFQLGMGLSLSRFGALDNFVDLFRLFLERLRPAEVLDLCSGSGIAAAHLWETITSSYDGSARPRLVLSDLFPNLPAFSQLEKEHPGLEYFEEPVDAMAPPAEAPRVRTMFNCLHHFRPKEARKILAATAESAHGIAVFEISRRSWINLLHALLFLPFVSAFITAFLIRPLRLQNLLWGVLIPVIPIQTAFDGVVSNLRSYTVEELEEITRSIEQPDFVWEVGTTDVPHTLLKATYLFGWRTSARIEHGGERC